MVLIQAQICSFILFYRLHSSPADHLVRLTQNERATMLTSAMLGQWRGHGALRLIFSHWWLYWGGQTLAGDTLTACPKNQWSIRWCLLWSENALVWTKLVPTKPKFCLAARVWQRRGVHRCRDLYWLQHLCRSQYGGKFANPPLPGIQKHVESINKMPVTARFQCRVWWYNQTSLYKLQDCKRNVFSLKF